MLIDPLSANRAVGPDVGMNHSLSCAQNVFFYFIFCGFIVRISCVWARSRIFVEVDFFFYGSRAPRDTFVRRSRVLYAVIHSSWVRGFCIRRWGYPDLKRIAARTCTGRKHLLLFAGALFLLTMSSGSTSHYGQKYGDRFVCISMS